jgi:hypothetical protein
MSETGFELSPLGAPMGIREVALLIGCSPWSVRQTLLPKLRAERQADLLSRSGCSLGNRPTNKRKEVNIRWPSISGVTSGGLT